MPAVSPVPQPCRIERCPIAAVPGLRLCRLHWPTERGKAPLARVARIGRAKDPAPQLALFEVAA